MAEAENTLGNDATVETLFNEQPHIFSNVEDFKADLLEEMHWDISEGNTSFTPLTLDDIPVCERQITDVPETCDALIENKVYAIDTIRQLEVDERNFQMYL